MSFGAAIVRAVSFRNLKRRSPKAQAPLTGKSIEQNSSVQSITTTLKEEDYDSETNQFNSNIEDCKRQSLPSDLPRFLPASSTDSIASTESPRPLYSAKKAHFRKCCQPQSEASHRNLIVEQILHKFNELEYTLHEDQQQEFKLRMALEKQTERVNDLRFSLDAEKQRNQRLLQLMRSVDASKASEDEQDRQSNQATRQSQWQSTMESISPLLMQQRYDDLQASYRQCRRQMAKKEKLLSLSRCEKEELQAKYDYLFDEYRREQKRFEDLCGKFLTLQFKKKQELFNMREALTHASDCIISAQTILDNCEDVDKHDIKEFKQNLQYFVKALRHCSFLPLQTGTPVIKVPATLGC